MDPRPPSIWKRLQRLFRSGPVLRHKIASGERLVEPKGTASAYKKELSSLYVRALASYANHERLSRYSDYQEMELTPELHSALDIYADETTVRDEDGHVIQINSRNEEIKEVLQELFFDVLNIDFEAWSWVRHLCKFGDLCLFVDANEENGILHMYPIPINEIEREEGYDPKDPMAVRFRWLTRGNMIIENWQIVHFRLLGNDAYLPYGCSMLEPARRIWRQLILIEDAMLVYRIVRAPERRVFHIEVGAIPPDAVEPFIEQVKNATKRSTIVDPETGRIDLKYNPVTVEEDYWFPKRGEVGSRVEPLPGGQFVGDIEDVQYIQNKMFAALKIPKAYLGYEAEIGSKSTLAQEDVRFAKTIERVQQLFLAELNKIAIIHLFILGYSVQDCANFDISMAAPSTVAQQQRLELWRMKLEVAGMAQEGVFDRGTMYRRIFDLNDSEIAKIKEGKRVDKLEDAMLESITGEAPPPSGGPGGGGDEGALPPPGPPAPGSEELPKTLGGPPGGGPPEIAGRVRSGATLSEFNRGSTGNRAEIAVDKGKNLFDPGENQFNHSFGTKKQTASDPYDRRSRNRTITRPFSEDADPLDDDSYTESIDEALEAISSWLRRNGHS